MTTLKSLPTQSSDGVSALRSREKSVLFCPSCGHESPLDGDWAVDADGDSDTYRCPECRAVISDREN